jgi:glycosyltransferase involved in cell wall biosynthesis
MPEITVIMGVHNGGPYLAPAVASVQAQTWVDWELVVLENGSTDDAVNALEATNRDPRIRIVRHREALGCGGALRAAIAAARGRYLAVLDDDDLAARRRLELQKLWLDAQPDIELLATATEVIDGGGRVVVREPFAGLHEDIHALTAFVQPLRHSSVMFRRELAERVPYRDELGGAADFDFVARAAEVGRVAALPAVLCQYRRHGGNVTMAAAARTTVEGAMTRWLTRRRRSGLDENLADAVARFGAIRAGATDVAAADLACAKIFRAAGQHDLAAVHAWQALRASRRFTALDRYSDVILRTPWPAVLKAWCKEPAHQLLRRNGMPDRWQF